MRGMDRSHGDSLVDSIKAKLESLSPLSNQCCIYKVPNKLHRLNPDAYSPRLVSFGPFHRGKEDLQAMEEHKYRYLQSFLHRTSFSLEELVRVARTWEENARNCYSEDLKLNMDEFVEMLVVDGTFLVELLLRSHYPQLRGEVLKIPTIIIDDLTETLFRNIIVFEQCHCSDKSFLHYTRLLSCFIRSPADADLLIRSGIFLNYLGNAEDVSKLFNNICKEVVFGRRFYFQSLSENLQGYCNTPWNRWKVVLRRDYFHNPWSVASVLAALFLLILTFIQAVCSILAL